MSALHFRVRGEFHFTPPLKMELHFGVKQNFLTQNFLLKYHALHHRSLNKWNEYNNRVVISNCTFTWNVLYLYNNVAHSDNYFINHPIISIVTRRAANDYPLQKMSALTDWTGTWVHQNLGLSIWYLWKPVFEFLMVQLWSFLCQVPFKT